MDINNLDAINNDNTNNYSIINSLTNAFNRGVAILSSVASYVPFFSRETDNNVLPEDNIGIEDRDIEPISLEEQLSRLRSKLSEVESDLSFVRNEIFQQRSERVASLRQQIKELIEIKMNLHYDMLPELPEDIEYDTQSSICPISWEPLKKGTTVYCNKQLYDFECLKKVSPALVPHTREPIDWDKNVFKLPNHGIDNYNETS